MARKPVTFVRTDNINKVIEEKSAELKRFTPAYHSYLRGERSILENEEQFEQVKIKVQRLRAAILALFEASSAQYMETRQVYFRD